MTGYLQINVSGSNPSICQWLMESQSKGSFLESDDPRFSEMCIQSLELLKEKKKRKFLEGPGGILSRKILKVETKICAV